MLGPVYTSLSGLLTFSRGLDVLSNNVTNLNTPGYKGSELQFREQFYRYRMTGENNGRLFASQIGSGVVGQDTSLRFGQGDLQETGEGTDIAIDGNGFFVLRDGGNELFTRAGQFAFDEDGYLVARGSDARVLGMDASGSLVDISLSGLRSRPPKATSRVSFVNNLSTGATGHEVSGVEVFDRLGKKHELTVVFTNNSSEVPRSWLIEVKDENGDTVAAGGEIRFQGNGSPEVGFNQFSFTFEPEDTDPSEINLFFGEPGSFTGATSFSAGESSDLAVQSQDGFAAGSLVSTSFDQEGQLTLDYSNGQTAQGPRVALAWANDLQALRQVGKGLFVAADGQEVRVGVPMQGVMGQIIGSTVELSNVELTQEFTDLIIMQRGYQASSQVLTVANEMIQQLLDASRGGR